MRTKRSAVAFSAISLVSCASAVAPSKTTAESSNVICDDKLLLSPPPKNAYTSAKLELILVPAARSVSPVPSFAELPIDIFCLVMNKPLFSYSVIYMFI